MLIVKWAPLFGTMAGREDIVRGMCCTSKASSLRHCNQSQTPGSCMYLDQTDRSVQHNVFHFASPNSYRTTSINSYHTLPDPVDLPQPYHASLYHPFRPPTSTMHNTIPCRLPSDEIHHTTLQHHPLTTLSHTPSPQNNNHPQPHHSPCTMPRHALKRPHPEVTSAIHRQKHKPGVSQLCKI